MTVTELLHRISSHELTEWEAFAELEPFGSEREMFGHAITASTVFNRLRGVDQKPLPAERFMPVLRYDEIPEEKEQTVEEQTVEEQIGIIEMVNISADGKDLRKHK